MIYIGVMRKKGERTMKYKILLLVILLAALPFLPSCSESLNSEDDFYFDGDENYYQFADEQQTDFDNPDYDEDAMMMYPELYSETEEYDNSDPYKAVVSDYYNYVQTLKLSDYDMNWYRYALLDIDGNGVDELLLSKGITVVGQDENGSDAGEKTQVYCKIYTIRNGEAWLVLSDGAPFPETDIRASEVFTQFGGTALRERTILSNGVLRVDDSTSPDCPSYCYFRYQDGFTQYIEQLAGNGDEYFCFYDVKGESKREAVSEEQFYYLKAEIEDGAGIADIEWQPLERYGQ